MKNQKVIGWRLNATNASYSIAQSVMGCHKWDIRAEKCEIVTPALWKNLVFQLVSAKIRPRKTFGSRKFQPRSIRTLPMQLSNKQMDPLNTIVEKERRNKEMQRAMGNVESVSKKFKNFSSFSDKNWPENYFWQKLSQHAAQLNGVPSMNAKILPIRSLL